MATKKTDWKTESALMGLTRDATNAPKLSRVLLEKGKRTSTGNRGLPTEDTMQILEGMQGNLTWRGHNATAAMKKRVEDAKKRNPKLFRDRLKGLFGSGDGRG